MIGLGANRGAEGQVEILGWSLVRAPLTASSVILLIVSSQKGGVL